MGVPFIGRAVFVATVAVMVRDVITFKVTIIIVVLVTITILSRQRGSTAFG